MRSRGYKSLKNVVIKKKTDLQLCDNYQVAWHVSIGIE